MSAATMIVSVPSRNAAPDAPVTPSVAAEAGTPAPASTATAAMATLEFAMIASKS